MLYVTVLRPAQHISRRPQPPEPTAAAAPHARTDSVLLGIGASPRGKNTAAVLLVGFIQSRHEQLFTHALAFALPLRHMVCPEPLPSLPPSSMVPLRTLRASQHTEKQNKRDHLLKEFPWTPGAIGGCFSFRGDLMGAEALDQGMCKDGKSPRHKTHPIVSPRGAASVRARELGKG